MQKIYEDKYGVIKWTCLDKDIADVSTNPLYASSKANGSVVINIEDLTNSLIWNNESKQWLSFNMTGCGL